MTSDIADSVLDTADELGPVDYLVVEYPPGWTPDGTALTLLLDLVDRDIVRVLDLTFIRKDADGTIAITEIADLNLDGHIDVALFAEASSGLLDSGDLNDAGGVLEPGSSAAVLVYENRWAAPFAAAVRRSGAQLVASGRIPAQGLLESVDALDGDN
ncbi:DUF6325 family protein [Aldersonia sp. NBC_00410]|uniref:DUF6325 family protein n=1 Tax=Aldersonia sp. NBC_00410 TaxID=2975954 RepID=UPI0022542C05|nr:DUF6325 family protein [Aldersonia sp. NBC_00410]MCX5041829.1 DUF6325 family protein [Aldersonia sp. NBC_00410]